MVSLPKPLMLTLIAALLLLLITIRAADATHNERVIVRSAPRQLHLEEAPDMLTTPPPLPLSVPPPSPSPPQPPPPPPRIAAWRMGRPVPVYPAGLGGYNIFRIPALCRAAKALLAFAEARPTVEDNGSIDLVVRRSTDGGRTWSDLKVVVAGRDLAAQAGTFGGMTVGNPVPIFLPPSAGQPAGRLLLLFCSNAASVNEDAIREDTTVAAGAGRRVWLCRSSDGGATWSSPLEITDGVKRAGWTWYATGPGGGLVLRNGSLVVPATHAEHGTNEDHSHVLASHDGGESWTIGADAAYGTNEACAAQLADDSLLLNARDLSSVRGGGPTRLLQRSSDGGATWGSAWRAARLAQPTSHRGCHGSMVAAEGGRALFFAAPDSALRREKLTLHRSDDGGRSWPRSVLLHAGPSAYSSLGLLPGGCLGVLFERGERRTSFFAEQIAFVRVPLAASSDVEVSPLGTLEVASVPPGGTTTQAQHGLPQQQPAGNRTTFESSGLLLDAA